MSNIGYLNTDRELWREREDDYYADSIFVTQSGGIGIKVGGSVVVKPLKEWHRLARIGAREALAAVINHWDEFGPEHGFDEQIDMSRPYVRPVGD